MRPSGADFSQYRDTTIKRRTARRMLLRGFRSPAEYAKYLERDPLEAEALYRDVLINVTSFFREPEAFEELKREVFPEILRTKKDSQPIRIWVPGCSTGQEPYSLAIALLEFLESVNAVGDIQIFATDLGDPAVLDRARSGVYPESIESEVSSERLRRYFTKEDRTYRIDKRVRDVCVFARQNITVDPPFSRVDLVSCRNVLIYMSTAMQDRLLPVFHFALNQHGFLMLGHAETVGPFADLFELVSRRHKIYRRKQSSRRPQLTFMADEWLAGLVARPVGRSGHPPDFPSEADRLTLGHYAPPSVSSTLTLKSSSFVGGRRASWRPRRASRRPMSCAWHGADSRPSCGRLWRKPRPRERRSCASTCASRTPAGRSNSRFACCPSRWPSPRICACWCCSRRSTGQPGRRPFG